MRPSTEEDLRTALRAATDRIVAPADLAERVTAAIPRPTPRPSRGRLPLLLTPVAVVAVVGAALFVVPRTGGQDRGPAVAVDEDLLSRPTGGDLAGDGAVTAAAVGAFAAGVGAPDYGSASLPTPPPGAVVDSAPRVLWAGSTRTGPAAVVVRRETGPAGPVVAVGYLGTVRGEMTLATVSRPTTGYGDFAGSFVGTGSRTLLVVDRGSPVSWSYTRRYRPGGGIQLLDRPVTFTQGVAVVEVPAGVEPGRVRLTRPGTPDRARVLAVGGGVSEESGDSRLPWFGPKDDPEAMLFPVGGGAAGWPEPSPSDGDRYGQLLFSSRRAIDALPSDLALWTVNDSLWFAYGSTPDGRRLVATDLAAAADPARAYVVLQADGRPATVVDGGPIDLDSPVPFRVRLPGGQGWLVAAWQRQLSWRTGTGAWTDTGRDAALLPAAATEVRAGDAVVTLR